MLSGEKRYKRKGVAEGRGIRECGLHLVGQEKPRVQRQVERSAGTRPDSQMQGDYGPC